MLFEEAQPQYVITTAFIPEPMLMARRDRPAPVLHAWGPYPSKREATNAAARMKRRDKREQEDGNRRPGKLHVHVGILNQSELSLTISDTAEHSKDVKRCIATESGGQQCELIAGHKGGHWIGFAGETDPEAFYAFQRSES